jgi:PAS domain-containing protein
VNKLRFISQVFVNALSRKRNEEILWESEERLRLAASITGAGYWDFTVSTGKLWTNGGTQNLYDIKPDKGYNLKEFLKKIHPDDRDRVKNDIQNSVNTGTFYNEHRIVLPGEQIRWISGHATIHKNSEKKRDRLIGISTDITHTKSTQITTA